MSNIWDYSLSIKLAQGGGKPPPPKDIDIHSDEWTERLRGAELYKKHGPIRAEQVTEDTLIETPKDKTKAMTPAGHWKATEILDDGEGGSWPIDPETFSKRYEPDTEAGEGRYRPKGAPQPMVPITRQEFPFGVRFPHPWAEGETMTVQPDSPTTSRPAGVVTSLLDEEGNPTADRYAIQGPEFQQTYKKHVKETKASRQFCSQCLEYGHNINAH